ncbi:MAG: DHHA1 domain-containing protein [Candidatus Freyarchaeota archaeon]|nr:DHHA1 domain-containing protein [Candidatus Freyrarchaeum guaymaensis]
MRVAVHGTDCDGIISAALILVKYPDAEIVFVNNPKDASKLEGFFDMVVDLPKPINCRVNIDHHESNYKNLVKEGRLTEDDVVSPSAPAAAKLVAEYLKLKGGIIDELVSMAVAADTGKHTEATLALDRVIKFLHSDDAGRRRLAEILARKGAAFTGDEWFREQYEKLAGELRVMDNVLNEVVNSLGDVEGKFYLVNEVDVTPYYLAKDIAYKLLSKGCDTVALVYRDADTGSLRASIRVHERSSTDAREIAESLGGGGHRKAAGIPLSKPQRIIELLDRLAETSPNHTVTYLNLKPYFEGKGEDKRHT